MPCGHPLMGVRLETAPLDEISIDLSLPVVVSGRHTVLEARDLHLHPTGYDRPNSGPAFVPLVSDQHSFGKLVRDVMLTALLNLVGIPSPLTATWLLVPNQRRLPPRDRSLR